MDLSSLGLQSMVSALDTQKSALQEAINNVSSSSSDDMQKNMVMLQFQLGQYNAMVEAVANITKSMTDMLKSLAQKVS